MVKDGTYPKMIGVFIRMKTNLKQALCSLMKYGIIVRWKLFSWNIWGIVEMERGDEAASFFNKIKNTIQIQ